jgi:hypothetical protein
MLHPSDNVVQNIACTGVRRRRAETLAKVWVPFASTAVAHAWDEEEAVKLVKLRRGCIQAEGLLVIKRLRIA